MPEPAGGDGLSGFGPCLIHVGGSILESPAAFWEVADSALAHLEQESTWLVVAAPAALRQDAERAFEDASPANVNAVLHRVEALLEGGMDGAARKQLRISLEAALATGRRSVARWTDRATALALGARLATGGHNLPLVCGGTDALPPHYGALVAEADLAAPRPGAGEQATIELAVQLGSPEVRFWKADGGLRAADGVEILESVDAGQLLLTHTSVGPLHRLAVEASMQHGVELLLENPALGSGTRIMPGTPFILRAGLANCAAAA